jgi:hypothetical protein
MSLMLANRYFIEGKDEWAIPCFMRHLDQHPEDRQAVLRLSCSLLRSGRAPEAERHLQAVAPSEPARIVLRLICLLLRDERHAWDFLKQHYKNAEWSSCWESCPGWLQGVVEEVWERWRSSLPGTENRPMSFAEWIDAVFHSQSAGSQERQKGFHSPEEGR